jgi:organic hydroperoxide reductase OsmC/OhrA
MRRRPAAAIVQGMEHTFPVRVEWVAGRQVVAGVLGKQPLLVAAPPEFDPEADPAVWSPEDLLCNALASCVAVTLTGQAVKRGVPIVDLAVTAAGTVARGAFTGIDVEIELVTEPGFEERAELAVERSEHCLVGASLGVPVRYSSAVSPGLGSTTPDSGVPTTGGRAGRR